MKHARRHVSLGLLLLLLISIFAAPAAAQDEGTIIRWSIEGISDLPTLDPSKLTDAPGFVVIGFLYGGLVRFDENLLVVPDLAESWSVSDDGLTYTFTLREGAAFSDGSPITSADVLWSFENALSPESGAWTGPYLLGLVQGAREFNAGEADTISGIEIIDDRTIAITISQPSAYFLSQLTFGPSKILSRAAAEANPDTWDQNPVTSGAFSIAERTSNGFILVPNPYYFEPASQVSELHIIFNQNSETAFQLFRTGEVDIVGGAQNPIPAARVPEVRDTPDFRTTNAFNLRYVAFNNRLPPFDDVRVRQAFAHAVDRDTLANVVLGGTVTPTDRIIPAGMPGSELPIEGLAFDPARGVELLQEAGINPSEFTLTLTYGVEGDNERVVTVLQSMWQENLGVTVTLEPLELQTFSARLTDTFLDPANGLQAYYSVWGTIYPDPQYFTSQILHTGVANNNAHYSNPEFDALVEEADVITDDYQRRIELYNRAEQIAVTEVGWLPLFNGQVNVLVRECVQGVVVTGLYSAYVIPNFSELAGCPAS